MSIYDKKTIEQFEDLKESLSFKEKVAQIREKVGIPKNGFDVEALRNKNGLFFADSHLPNRKKLEILKLEEKNLIKNFKLSSNLNLILHEYILKGPDYDQGFIAIPGRRFGCGGGNIIEGDHINIQIYPGATKQDVRNFLSDKWDDIQETLQLAFPEAYEKRIKKKTKRTRDKDIMDLYDKKVIKVDGNFNNEIAKKFLESQGVTNPVLSPRSFQEIGIDLPNIDARKKIIQKHRGLRKK